MVADGRRTLKRTTGSRRPPFPSATTRCGPRTTRPLFLSIRRSCAWQEKADPPRPPSEPATSSRGPAGKNTAGTVAGPGHAHRLVGLCGPWHKNDQGSSRGEQRAPHRPPGPTNHRGAAPRRGRRLSARRVAAFLESDQGLSEHGNRADCPGRHVVLCATRPKKTDPALGQRVRPAGPGHRGPARPGPSPAHPTTRPATRSGVNSEASALSSNTERARLHRQRRPNADRQVRRRAADVPASSSARSRSARRSSARLPPDADRRGPDGPGAPGGCRPGAGAPGAPEGGPADTTRPRRSTASVDPG